MRDMVPQAIEFGRGYLERDAGDMFAVSAEARTIAKTITILARSVRAGAAPSGEERWLLARLLEAAEELNLVEACQLLVNAVTRARSEGYGGRPRPESRG